MELKALFILPSVLVPTENHDVLLLGLLGCLCKELLSSDIFPYYFFKAPFLIKKIFFVVCDELKQTVNRALCCFMFLIEIDVNEILSFVFFLPCIKIL